MRSALLVTLLAAGVVMGCSPTVTTSPSHPSPPTPPPSLNDPTGARAAYAQGLPLEAYEIRSGSPVAVAETILTARCLRQRGFTPRAVVPDEPVLYDDTPNPRTGYHVVHTDPRYLAWAHTAQLVEYADRTHPPTAAYQVAAYGPGGTRTGGVGGRDGGCAGDAELAIGGPAGVLSGVSPLVKELDLDTNARADTDPRVRAVALRWSECMTRSGYHYGTPYDALQDPQIGDSTEASPAELARARADIACQIRYRYWPTRHRVLAGLQSAAIQQHVESLGPLRQALDAEVRRAAAVVAHG